MDPASRLPSDDSIESGKRPNRSTLRSSPHPAPAHQPCHEIQEELLVFVAGPRAGAQDLESAADLLARIAKPGWAEERAVALMRTGATMPQMIEHLVAKGLSAGEATRVAEKVFEDRLRQPGVA
jgi:hypothetical protein